MAVADAISSGSEITFSRPAMLCFFGITGGSAQKAHACLGSSGNDEDPNLTARLLLVSEKFSEALKTIGQAPTKELIEVEKKEEQRPATRQKYSLSDEMLDRMLDEEICPTCGSKGRIHGYDGSDGDSFNWFECGNCNLMFDLRSA